MRIAREAHMLKLLGGSHTREQMWRAWLASPTVRAQPGHAADLGTSRTVFIRRCSPKVKACPQAGQDTPCGAIFAFLRGGSYDT